MPGRDEHPIRSCISRFPILQTSRFGSLTQAGTDFATRKGRGSFDRKCLTLGLARSMHGAMRGVSHREDKAVLESLGELRHEVIFVDDDGSDGTLQA